jgi:hypothetical protein
MDYPLKDWMSSLDLLEEERATAEAAADTIFRGDHDNAELLVDDLQGRMGSETAVLLLRYELEWQRGRWVDALPWAERLRALHPDNAGSCCRLVQSLVGLGRFTEAHGVLLKASIVERSHHFNSLFANDLPYLEMISHFSIQETGGVSQCSDNALSVFLQSEILSSQEKTELARVIGHYYSDKVQYSAEMFASLIDNCQRHRVAILFPGRLRTFDLYRAFFFQLSQVADIYVCVDAAHGDDIAYLKSCGVQVSCYEDDPILAGEASFISNPQLHQWLKYQRCVDMMLAQESLTKRRYDYVMKCRTDHVVAYAQNFDLAATQGPTVKGINDMLLFGPRDVMVTLREVYSFAQVECMSLKADQYWKIRWENSLSFPPIWWSGFPTSVIGTPSNADDFFRLVEERRQELQSYLPAGNDSMISLLDILRGEKIDAHNVPEVWLARYLNQKDIMYEHAETVFGALIGQRK